jgi:DNA-binding transcriptional LysR family regulator
MPFDFERGLFNITKLDDERVLSGQFWGELRVFLAVAKTKSFNRAAEILGSSQPTVSRQIKRLQDLLGFQLITATSQGIVLTEEGRRIAASASDLDERLYALSGGVKAHKGEIEGVVSVSVPDTIAAAFIAPAIKTFSRRYPKIQLRLKPPRNHIDARHDNADVNIAFHPVGLHEWISRPLGTIHLVPMASREYIKEFGYPANGALQSHRFVMSSLNVEGSGVWDNWINLCHNGSVVHHCDEPLAYTLLVTSGVGVGLLPNYLAADSRVVPLDFGFDVAMQMHLVVLCERLKARHVQVVCDWVERLLSEASPWLRRKFQLDSPRDDEEEFGRLLARLPPKEALAG